MMPALAISVGLAYLCEATAGFGSTLVALSLGAFFLSADRLLPILIPLNLLLSISLVARHRDTIAWTTLRRWIVPWAALGLPLGLAAFAWATELLARGLAIFVLLFAAFELWRLWRQDLPFRMPPWARASLLALAGVVHGALGTGGPLVVLVAGQDLSDKQAFRGTLSALWVCLNTVLCATYLARGAIGPSSLGVSARLLPVVAVALFGGEWLFRRVDRRRFRGLIAGLLLITGALLLLRPAASRSPGGAPLDGPVSASLALSP